MIERITGVRQQETVPDEVVRRAEQIELVDITPEALRRRMAHGNVYAAGEGRRRAGQLLPAAQPHRAAGAGAAVAGRPGRGRPAALPHGPADHRHLGDPRAGRRRADRRSGERDGAAPRRPHRRTDRVVRAVRRARAPRRRPRRCPGRGGHRAAPPRRERRRDLPHASSATDVPTALLEFARGVDATQLVIGTSRRSRLARVLRREHRGAGRAGLRARSTCTWSPTPRRAAGSACPAG